MPTRAAVVQAGSFLFDLHRTAASACEWISKAAEGGAQLVVFPEAFLGGYPKGLDFGAKVGSRSDDGRRWFARYFDSALTIPGPAFDLVSKSVAEAGVAVLLGAVERHGATLYCSVLFFGPDGSLLARHRKVMPTAMERLIWGFGDGSTLAAVDYPFGRTAAVICWENYMPQLRLAMYAKGVEIYCAPTVDDRETWPPTMRHIAVEGRCFVLSAVQVMTRDHCPADYPAAPLSGEHYIRGGSLIADPFGRILAGPERDRECVLTADLDLTLIPQARYDLDVVGHYARPDIFRLLVDESPKNPVERSDPPQTSGRASKVDG